MAQLSDYPKAAALMSDAKSKLVARHIFYAAIVVPTKFVVDERCRTAYTDMRVIGFNPKFIESLSSDVILFVVVHEAMHIILMHGWRQGSRNHKRWNMACDYMINLACKESGLKVWEHALLDERFKGMSAEAIYDIITEEGKNHKPKSAGGGTGKAVGSAGEDMESFMDDIAEPIGADDNAARAEAEQDILVRVSIAATQARMCGQMPAHLDRLVDGIVNPPLTWQEILRDYCNAPAKIYESWNHRNRRFANVYLPARHGEKMGEIVVIGDTSGSMGDEFFAQLAEELKEIREKVNPERVRVIWADDAECSLEEVFEEGEDLDIHPKGGGGTDMRKPLRYVEQFNPCIVILATDGYTPWPTEEPPYDLITICSTNQNVPIGRTIRMNP
jgi:predicted metal-dependent peptidase